MVSVLGATPNLILLKYRCLIDKSNQIRDIDLTLFHVLSCIILAWTHAVSTYCTRACELISRMNPTLCTYATICPSMCVPTTCIYAHVHKPPMTYHHVPMLHACPLPLVSHTMPIFCTCSPPPFHIYFLFFGHRFVLGKNFGMWPFFIGKLVGHVSMICRLPPPWVLLYIDFLIHLLTIPAPRNVDYTLDINISVFVFCVLNLVGLVNLDILLLFLVRPTLHYGPWPWPWNCEILKYYGLPVLC